MTRFKPPGTPVTTGMLPSLAISLMCATGPNAIAQEATPPLYEFHPPAAWVDITAPDYAAPTLADRVANGTLNLLYDRQINVTDEGDEDYRHYAFKLLNAVGVEDRSQIEITVDPTYQSLHIHALRIVRDHTVIDQTDMARITALPEETERRSRIYNGSYNIDVLLSDVRSGDIVEYSYTLFSREQLFPRHFAAQVSTAWSSPLHRQRIRILSPVDRPIRYRLSDSEVTPPTQVHGNVREFVLERSDVAAVLGDDDRPGWYETWPYLDVSDLESWSEAASLVEPLFAPRPQASTRVAEVVRDVRGTGGTPERQALRALQYVQDEIRYTSISIGRGSHEPADPDTVLQRRFGDCKDKSLLLVTILNDLGIEAETALVDTSRGRSLDRTLPTPYAFNHAIVRATIGDEVYWLDPTDSITYSPLSESDPPDYERALLPNGTGAYLEIIPLPAPDTRRREVSMVFDMRDGLDEPATLEMTTRFTGGLADSMRQSIARGSPEQRQLDYTNYIAGYYPGARSTAPVDINDDKASNVVEIREFYTLPRTFTDEDGILSFFLHADELYSYGDPLDSSVRQAPLAINYPVHVRQLHTVYLPEEWLIEPETVTVENPAFRYQSDVRYADRTLEVSFEYQALADHVTLEQLPQYEIDRARFYDDTGYSLTYDTGFGERTSLAPAPLIAMLAAFVLSAWIAIRWGYRYDPEPREPVPGAPSGIRGWLLLPALAVVIGPFVFGWLIYAWAPFLDEDMWRALPTVVAKGYGGSAQYVLMAILSVGVAAVVGALLIAILFFSKRTSVPTFYIAWCWTAFMFALMVWGAVVLWELDTESTGAEFVRETMRDVLSAIIWTFYMLKSKRVKATFVNRWRQRELANEDLVPKAA